MAFRCSPRTSRRSPERPRATLGNGVWRFQPAANWSGVTQMRYVAYGAGGWSQPAYLTITVTPVASNNTDSGIAWDDSHPQSPVTGNVITDGTVDRGDTLHVVTYGTASHGDLTINPRRLLQLRLGRRLVRRRGHPVHGLRR